MKPTAALASDVFALFFKFEDEKRGYIAPAKSLIAEKYSSSDDTDVTVTVSPYGGESVFSFQVNSTEVTPYSNSKRPVSRVLFGAGFYHSFFNRNNKHAGRCM